MKAITIKQVAVMKAADVREYNNNRQYAGDAATDQRIDYVLNLSDEEYMNLHNEVARRENMKEAAAKDKKAYRAEYDALMAEYKRTGNSEAKNAAKAIAKFAF